MIRISSIFIFSLLLGFNTVAPCYNVKLLTWNLLNYPSSSALTADTLVRNPNYRTVVQYVNPDIMVTQENASTNSVSMFLNNVMNNSSILGGNQYSAGAYINGPDTDNGIFYKTSLFQFISNTPIHTALRDINEFKLVHLATGDTIRILSCHLKAGSSSADSIARSIEVDQLRAYTNLLPIGTDFIICGDFNIYGSGEIAYQKIKQDNVTDDGNFVDPLNLTGYWNYYPYRFHHTQSTRTRSFGNGSTGGLDDRFDMILYSTAVSQPGGITYVSGTTVPVGNDGGHWNDSINQQPNTAVPVNVANALHYASDHLPVTSTFSFVSATGSQENEFQKVDLTIFPNPTNGDFSINYYLSQPAEVAILIADLTGRLVMNISNHKEFVGVHSKLISDVSRLNKGIFFIHLSANNKLVANKLFVVE